MGFLADLSSFVSANVPLAARTYLGVGGPARWLARPRTLEELREVVRRCHASDTELRVLGLGANLLVCDEGVDGVVVHLGTSGMRGIDWGDGPRDASLAGLTGADAEPAGVDADEVVVLAGAGAHMNRMVLDAARHGLSGLECMAGIPGTLGGILRMNAGGRWGEIADVVLDVTVIDREGRLRRLSKAEAGFRYRNSSLGDMIVCGARLRLRRDDEKRVRERFMAIWDYKKQTQPLAQATAGCVFKNPPGQSAGELVDRAGFKHVSVGGAEVSGRHANFIVAKEGATATDVLELIRRIRCEVRDRYGVELELEVEVWQPREARAIEAVA